MKKQTNFNTKQGKKFYPLIEKQNRLYAKTFPKDFLKFFINFFSSRNYLIEPLIIIPKGL